MSKLKQDRVQGTNPESQQFNKFKRKYVSVSYHGKEIISGELAWVDVYTMGIQTDASSEPSIVYKGPGTIVTLNG